MKKEKMKQKIAMKIQQDSQKGITLISLIITIILLIILAGITLNLVLGENGLLNQAKRGAEQYQYAGIKERVESEILALDMDKVVKGETLTIEDALISLQEKGIFEETDFSANSGICEGYVIELGYNEEGKVVILGIQKDTGVRIVAKLNPTGYTNSKVEVSILISTNKQKITSIEVPEEMKQKEEGIYEVEKNGIYLVKVVLEDGQILEKEISIATIDRLAPKDFTPTIQQMQSGFAILANAEDEADEENVKSGIDYYEYYLNDIKQESNEIKEDNPGTYKVYVMAYDKAGNNTKSQEVEVKISRKVAQVAAGTNHSLAIDTNGNLWAWGYNTYGQLGDGTTENKTSPVQIQAGTKFQKITAGANHSLAIDTNGNLWAWGDNSYGQLGDGTKEKKASPVQIQAGTKFKQVITKINHSLAIDTNNNLWAWGYNDRGALGDGTTENKTSPVQINTETKFQQVAVGRNHSFAIDTNNNLWAWGDNTNRKLGIEIQVLYQKTPIIVIPEKAFNKVEAMGVSSFAIDTNGNLWAWGYNQNGELGDGTTELKANPVQIKSETKFKQIAAGMSHTLAIDTNDNLWAWGANSKGQLGDGTTELKANPVQIKPETKFKQIAAGSSHTLAIDTEGNLWGWGYNLFWQLADGTREDKIIPIQITF